MFHRAPLRSIAILAAVAAPAVAMAATSEWAEGESVRARLVASGEDGAIRAALEIELDPGWKTYWRTPGEGGLAPAFDFSGSWNVADVVVSYPPPHRSDDGLTVTNVYDGRLVLPLEIRSAAPGTPVTLDLALTIGVCETICIPVSLDLVLTTSPARFDPAVASMIAVAEARVPGPPRPDDFAVTALRLTGSDGDRATLEATAILPGETSADLFIETPAGWYPRTPVVVATSGQAATFRFDLDRLGTAPELVGSALTLTVVSDGEAIEQTVTVE